MITALVILAVIALFFLFVLHWRKKHIILRIRHMRITDKQKKLNKLANPLGYWYEPEQDIFSSTRDAWQKSLGYGEIYNRSAPFAGMVFDNLPLYFDYDGKTWLIEFWKGQYGLSTGCEIGIYHADEIIPPELHRSTIFHAPKPEEYLDISCLLRKNGVPLASLTENHWWLTIFLTGRFSHPWQLSMDISLSFPDLKMRDAFLDSLLESGYDLSQLSICFTTVSFSFHHCCLPGSSLFRRFQRWQIQLNNRFLCRLYHDVTSPFYTERDRLLYLYYHMPFAFRRILPFRRHIRWCHIHRQREETSPKP